MRSRRVGLLVVALSFALPAHGCAADTLVDWTIVVGDAFAADTARVHLAIHRGSCSARGSAVFEDDHLRGDGPIRSSPPLEPGAHAFVAEAVDASCRVIAFDCEEQDLFSQPTAIRSVIDMPAARAPCIGCDCMIDAGRLDGGDLDAGGRTDANGDAGRRICAGDCTCAMGETCAFECRSLSCRVVCEAGATCSVTCRADLETGTCEIDCRPGATSCALDCPKSIGECANASSCTICDPGEPSFCRTMPC